jgi:hypothetical protein
MSARRRLISAAAVSKRSVSKRFVSKPAVSKASARPAVAAERRIVEGRVTEVLADGRARMISASGRVIDCRCPHHVSVEWLRAAVEVGPVDAEISVGDGRDGTLWCLLPGPEHAGVAPRRLDLVAQDSLKIACGDSTLSLDKAGTIRVTGRDVGTRGSRVARLQGGTVRIN